LCSRAFSIIFVIFRWTRALAFVSVQSFRLLVPAKNPWYYCQIPNGCRTTAIPSQKRTVLAGHMYITSRLFDGEWISCSGHRWWHDASVDQHMHGLRPVVVVRSCTFYVGTHPSGWLIEYDFDWLPRKRIRGTLLRVNFEGTKAKS
jgi:hypothetical protein